MFCVYAHFVDAVTVQNQFAMNTKSQTELGFIELISQFELLDYEAQATVYRLIVLLNRGRSQTTKPKQVGSTTH